MSTVNSYKGYEAEVVVLAGVEQFVVKGEGVLANKLYVAMTRARSVLVVFAYARKNPDEDTRQLLATLEECRNGLLDRPTVEREISPLDDLEDVLARLGAGRRDWLTGLWRAYLIQHEPLLAADGEILAEPVFWFQVDDRIVACFGDEPPGPHTLDKLDDHGIGVIRPGELLPEKSG